MVKITIDIDSEEDKKLKHLIIDENVVSKAQYIEKIVKDYLREKI